MSDAVVFDVNLLRHEIYLNELMTMTIYLAASHKLSYVFANKERKNSIQYSGTVVYMCVGLQMGFLLVI
jgi:hypothetical protein